MLRFDHLAVSALTLAEGVAVVEDALGVPLSGGGQHPHMSTHNRLLSLGDLYLEVIATDPTVPTPTWPLWFDLDHFTGPPRLTNWIAACNDLDAELAASPEGTGIPTTLSRGELRWRMAVPANGCLPYDGCFPALISWQGALHPAALLPDRGVRLDRLEIVHPDAEALSDHLKTRFSDPRVVFMAGLHKCMRASFSTPHGPRILGN